MRDDGSVASPARHLRAAFWAVWAAWLAIKLVLAPTLAPFGDEAFYWQESRHLDWAYSDLPPLTAWLIAASERLLGHGEFALRAPFLVLGAAVPLLLRRLGARWGDAATGDAATGDLAGLLWLLLPLGGSLGLLALPDVPLLFACAWALLAFDAALRGERLGDWAQLGAALALAWLTHYRAAMLLLAGLAFLLASPRGRAQWRRPGLWLALGLATLGLAPVLWFNLRHAWEGVAFQLVDRHPWRFHADALVQPLEQALAVTPLLYAGLLWTLWRGLRRPLAAPWDLPLVMGAVFVLGYFSLGLFADGLRFRAHWPLPGYLALLPLLAAQSGRCARWLRGLTLASAAAGSALTAAYFGLAAWPAQTARLAPYKLFPENFVGWHEVAAATRQYLDAEPGLLVADNFLLGAELDVQLGGARPVYVLDHPLNTKHGRAPQLAAWGLDEAGLRRQGEAPVLLVVEETAGRERERAAWLASLPRRVAALRRVGTLSLFGGRKRFAFYRGRAAPP